MKLDCGDQGIGVSTFESSMLQLVSQLIVSDIMLMLLLAPLVLTNGMCMSLLCEMSVVVDAVIKLFT